MRPPCSLTNFSDCTKKPPEPQQGSYTRPWYGVRYEPKDGLSDSQPKGDDMPQFCVIQGPLPERINAKLGAIPLDQAVPAPVYLFEDATRLFMPTYLGRPIDDVLAQSKAVYLDGVPFEKTDACHMLGCLVAWERQFVLWHGRDAARLPIVDNAQELFTALRAAFESTTCELYADFRVPQWK